MFWRGQGARRARGGLGGPGGPPRSTEEPAPVPGRTWVLPFPWLWGGGQTYWIALRHRGPPTEVGGLSLEKRAQLKLKAAIANKNENCTFQCYGILRVGGCYLNHECNSSIKLHDPELLNLKP